MHLINNLGKLFNETQLSTQKHLAAHGGELGGTIAVVALQTKGVRDTPQLDLYAIYTPDDPKASWAKGLYPLDEILAKTNPFVRNDLELTYAIQELSLIMSSFQGLQGQVGESPQATKDVNLSDIPGVTLPGILKKMAADKGHISRVLGVWTIRNQEELQQLEGICLHLNA